MATNEAIDMAQVTTLNPNDDTHKPTGAYFILPDLLSHWDQPLSIHPDIVKSSTESLNWIEENYPSLSLKQRRDLSALQSGTLAAYCYSYTSPERLRVLSDWMLYCFYLDDISDGMMTRDADHFANLVLNAFWFPERYMGSSDSVEDQPSSEPHASKMARDVWSRCIAGCAPGTQTRFKETMSQYFEAVHTQNRAVDQGVIMDLETYIDVRRDTSGCKPTWTMVEYALDLDLPQDVMEHPTIQALNLCANDFVTWSNDIFSYNVEQARGDTHNLIAVLMHHRPGLDIQGAMDMAGEMCNKTIHLFHETVKSIPSWDPAIDKEVSRYVDGLRHWITGSMHWCYQTERYFGKDGLEVKKHRVVKLLPPRGSTDNAQTGNLKDLEKTEWSIFSRIEGVLRWFAHYLLESYVPR